jgi:hypothetical protein
MLQILLRFRIAEVNCPFKPSPGKVDVPLHSCTIEIKHSEIVHRYCNCHDGCGPEGVPLGPRVRRLAGLGAATEFNRRENPAGRHHQARQPLFAPAAHQRGKRQSAAIEGDQSRSMGDRVVSAAAAAGRSGGGEQDGARRLGGDAAREGIPAHGCGGLVAHGTGAGACERAMTRDGTVGRSDATQRSLPFHWDTDPARMMRPRFADSIGASSPAGLREQAGT